MKDYAIQFLVASGTVAAVLLGVLVCGVMAANMIDCSPDNFITFFC